MKTDPDKDRGWEAWGRGRRGPVLGQFRMKIGQGQDRKGAEQGRARMAKAQDGGWDGAGLGTEAGTEEGQGWGRSHMERLEQGSV